MYEVCIYKYKFICVYPFFPLFVPLGESLLLKLTITYILVVLIPCLYGIYLQSHVTGNLRILFGFEAKDLP